MLTQKNESSSLDITEAPLPIILGVTEEEQVLKENPVGNVTKFSGSYQDAMELYAPASVVTDYLNTHGLWFARCAEPMKVQPLGENGYALGIGRFGAFGYQVEPKVGLELLPPEAGIYRVRTIPIPDYQPPGYDVDYNSSLQLIEVPVNDLSQKIGDVTRLEWALDLSVELHFPKFIQRLPHQMIQSTGDRLLNQIVRQVSRRLTYKVQQDFHQSLGIPFPGKLKKR